MAARPTPARRGRWIAAAAGLVCVGVVAWLGFHWRELHVRYLLGRLEQAQSFDEARGLIETVTWHGGDAEAVKTFVEGLGLQRKRELFWFLRYLAWDPEAQLAPNRFPVPSHLGKVAPLALAFWDRVTRDEWLLRSCACYVQWRAGTAWWASLDRRVERQPAGFWGNFMGSLILPSLGDSIGAEIEAQGRKHPGSLASLLCILRLGRLAEAWIAGMDMPILLANLPQPTGAASPSGDPAEWLEDQVETWLKQHWRRLTYDPAALRCTLLPSDAPDDPRPFAARGYPAPALPFPDWKGPLPEVPGMIR